MARPIRRRKRLATRLANRQCWSICGGNPSGWDLQQWKDGVKGWEKGTVYEQSGTDQHKGLRRGRMRGGTPGHGDTEGDLGG